MIAKGDRFWNEFDRAECSFLLGHSSKKLDVPSSKLHFWSRKADVSGSKVGVLSSEPEALGSEVETSGYRLNFCRLERHI